MTQTITVTQSEFRKLVNRINRLERMFADFAKQVTSKKKFTENGLTPEFEQMILDASRESIENDTVLKTKKDINIFFKHLDTTR